MLTGFAKESLGSSGGVGKAQCLPWGQCRCGAAAWGADLLLKSLGCSLDLWEVVLPPLDHWLGVTWWGEVEDNGFVPQGWGHRGDRAVPEPLESSADSFPGFAAEA